nr:hypothetical protein HAGR004_01310 [Bdellovibrio sp. HAGR004]
MKKKIKKKKFQQTAKAPIESAGSYYARKSGKNWYLMIETYLDGKRSQRPVDQARYHDLGFSKTMTLEQARARVREVNKLDRQKKSEYRAKIFSAKRAEWQKSIDKIYFPPEILESFLQDIKDTPKIKTKYLNRLVRCFEVVTEMIPKHVQAQPHQYNSSIKKIVNYFCKQKYSISYSSDIIMVMNMWAKHYAKHKGVYADLIEKMAPAYREAIKDAHDTKEESIRKRALPITRDEIENMRSQISKLNHEEMSYCRWVVASWLFGLRPSELDRFVLGDQGEDRVLLENGVKCINVKQTKTVNKSGFRHGYKKIPILSKEQEDALEEILTKPTRRPHPDWMDKKLRIKDKKYRPQGHKFDCYSGRKGFIDLMLSPEYNQKLENISVYLGHSSVTTSYVHYKDKENLHYTPTPFTEGRKTPKLVG